MSPFTITPESAPVELPLGPTQFLFELRPAGSGELVLDLIGPAGETVGAPVWNLQATVTGRRWVLDPRGLPEGESRLQGRLASGDPFGAGARLSGTIAAAGGAHYPVSVGNLAGRGVASIATLSMVAGKFTVQHGAKLEPPTDPSRDSPQQTQTIIVVDGSVSMMADPIKQPVQRTLLAIREVVGTSPSAATWELARDGRTTELSENDIAEQLSTGTPSWGSVWSPSIFDRPGRFIVVCDGPPAGMDSWLAMKEGRMQVVMVGSDHDPDSTMSWDEGVFSGAGGEDLGPLIRILASFVDHKKSEDLS